MNNGTDLEMQLLLAAAAAMKFANSVNVKEGSFGLMRGILEDRIREQVKWALNGEIPMEDAILHLNIICEKETAGGEPRFALYPLTAKIYQRLIEPF